MFRSATTTPRTVIRWPAVGNGCYHEASMFVFDEDSVKTVCYRGFELEWYVNSYA